MSRGERARPERTNEDRQRAREERERKRAQRGGADIPAPDSHGLDEPSVPGPAESEPVVPESVMPEPVAPESVVPEPVVPESVVPEPAAPEPVALPTVVPEQTAPDPEPDTEALEAVPAAIEPPVAQEPSHQPEPAGPVDELEPAPEPERVHDPEPIHESEHMHDPEPHDELELDNEHSPHSPHEDPEPEADEGPPRGLPPAPRRIASSPSHGRGREQEGGGRTPRGPREPRAVGAPHFSRVAAVVALVVVAAAAVAVVLAVHSLKGSKSKPPPAIPVVRVLIPEGKTRLQIAEIAKAAGLKGNYRTAAKSSDLLDPAQYGAPKGTPDLEGFLFPATYELDKGASARRLVEEQLEAFSEHFSAEYVSRAKALHETPYQLLIVASMIEREAQVPGDRAKIAAVIYNRLAKGMPLGIDAAIYYAVEEDRNIPTYTAELTSSDLQINSPYNTRTHTGLPPTPISNPGVASIQAAAHPAKAGYLYYVAGADGCGEQVFSDTQSQFEANVVAYEEAKRKNGGKPPKCKHG